MDSSTDRRRGNPIYITSSTVDIGMPLVAMTSSRSSPSDFPTEGSRWVGRRKTRMTGWRTPSGRAWRRRSRPRWRGSRIRWRGRGSARCSSGRPQSAQRRSPRSSGCQLNCPLLGYFFASGVFKFPFGLSKIQCRPLYRSSARNLITQCRSRLIRVVLWLLFLWWICSWNPHSWSFNTSQDDLIKTPLL